MIGLLTFIVQDPSAALFHGNAIELSITDRQKRGKTTNHANQSALIRVIRRFRFAWTAFDRSTASRPILNVPRHHCPAR